MRLRALGLLLVAFSFDRYASPQGRRIESQNESFTQLNTFGLFAEYSNNSSHIFLGRTEQRKIASVGASYSRRLFRVRSGEFRYLFEARPAFEVSDPFSNTAYASYDSRRGYNSGSFRNVPSRACHSFSFSSSRTFYHPPNGSYTISLAETVTCDRRWTYAQGLSPIGFQFVFRRRQPIRPFVTGNVGYLFSTRPVPLVDSGSFNFIFAFGAGFELYLHQHRALQLEYRLNHISNNYTAPSNPGIDSNLLRVAYTFGR